MNSVLLSQCRGLDTRPAWAGGDAFALADCENIQILPGGSIATRPALIKDADLHASSVGLYDRGGYLRALVPSGQSLQPLAPAGMVYDGIGAGGSFNYTGKIDEILAVETFGTSPTSGPYGYVVIRRSDTLLIEHHWIKEPPASSASYVNTVVSLPFAPGEAVVKIGQKIVATDPANGYFRYCSTLSGPDDWTTDADAGFEAALQFVSGAREITALGVHRGSLAVFYADAVQLWQMDPDPENIQLLQVINGPGTIHPRSVANIFGDAYFFGPSGFSNLSVSGVTGEATFGDVGDAIKTLTAAIGADDSLIGLWSQRRSQYLIASGSTIYCLSIYPMAEERTWTMWTLPVEVEAMTELNGIVYIRSDDVLYHLDDDQARDHDEDEDIAWELTTRQFGWGKAIAQIKALQEIVPQCSGRATYTPIIDGRTLTNARVIIPGSDTPIRAHFTGSGRRIALKVNGTGAMQIEGILLGAEVCGV